MGVPEDVPEGICGFTLEPEDVNVVTDVDGGEWYERRRVVCCTRDVWGERDTDRCVWHAEIEGKTAADLPGPANEEGERLERVFLRGADLEGVQSLRGKVLPFANLDDADLRDADLAGTFLGDASLVDADLRDANLADAFLGEANLVDADFWNADLADVDLWNADLADADFRNADLADAYLVNADLTGVFLQEADLSNAYLQNVDLIGAFLEDADLAGADLQDADLADAYLWDTDLADATLRYADLTDTDLIGVTARRTNLENARLDESDLENANLGLAALHDAQIRDVPINEGTTFADDHSNIGPYERRADWITEIYHRDDGPWWVRWLPAPLRMVRNRRHTEPEPLSKAVRTYREIQRLLRENSMPARAPAFYVREKHARRKQALAEQNRLRWLRLSAARWVTLYGESPWRVAFTSLGIILLFGVLYPLLGGVTVETAAPTHEFLQPLAGVSLPQPIETLLMNLYFSAVTFTTLGYGDIQPASPGSQALAAAESLVGAAMIALLVALLGRRLMR